MRRMFRVLSRLIMISLVFAVVGCGNNLSRDKAASAIEKAVEPLYLACASQTCEYYGGKRDLSRLESMGLIKNHRSFFATWITRYERCFFDLTEAANPYIKKGKSQFDFQFYVITATVNSVEVNGISKPSDLLGRKVCTATYTASYKPTPFGEALIEDKNKLSRSGQAVFVLYDDGWRLNNLE